jgi:hypothetical protein
MRGPQIVGRTGSVIILLALVAWALPIHAVQLPSEWRRSIGLSLVDVATDDTGLTVVTGETSIDADHRGFLVAAFDATGAELWRHSWLPLPDESSGTVGKGVTIGPDGNIYTVGFGWHCRFGCESGGWFIRSYSPEGALRWVRQAAGWRMKPRQSQATGIDAWPGGVAITGSEYDDDVGPTISWIRTYGLDGSFVRKARIRVAAATDVRVTSADIAVARRGAIFVAGDVGVVDPTTGWTDDREPFVAGFHADGGRRWTRIFRERGDEDDDAAVSVDARGGALVVGGVLGAPIGYGQGPPHVGWLARLSFAGDVRWIRSWGVERPQSVDDVVLASSGQVATVGGVRTRDRSYALVVRTYTQHGDLVGAQMLDAPDGSLVGSGLSFDDRGASLVGTRYRTTDLWPGIRGRLWRL